MNLLTELNELIGWMVAAVGIGVILGALCVVIGAAVRDRLK